MLLWLLLAALAGGGANALAGGGMFVVFPALLVAGVASVKANATASMVLLPGGMVAAWVYRGSLAGQDTREITWLTLISLVGSGVGSALLLSTSNDVFSNLVPWLLLIAAVVFTFAPRLQAMAMKSKDRGPLILLFVGQLIISIYGGYFGAGMGVLMIALFLVASRLGVQAANGIRLICATGINLLAVSIFAWRGALDWTLGLPMLAAGVTGGYIGARVVRRLNETTVRRAILIYAWALTAWFFAKRL